MFTAYGYGRASTDKQVLSTVQQCSVCHDAFYINKQVRPDWADAEWGGWYADEATMRTSDFRTRDKASMMLAVCKPGDIIFVSKYDRIFANVRDVCDTLEFLAVSKIRLKILDCDIDTTSSFGEAVFKILAVIKELDVKEIRGRTKAALQYRKSIGRPSGPPPIGYKNVRVQRASGHIEKYMIPDHAQRRFADEVFAIAGSVGCRKAAQMLNEMGIKPYDKRAKRWHRAMAYRWLEAVRHNFPLTNGQTEPAPIPADGTIVEFKAIKPDV